MGVRYYMVVVGNYGGEVLYDGNRELWGEVLYDGDGNYGVRVLYGGGRELWG